VRLKLATCTLAPALALALVAGACGGSDDDDEASTDTSEDTTETTAAADQAAAGGFIQTAQTDLGEVLVTQDGLTAYGFTNDTDGTSTCEDSCADAWPPVLVEGTELPEGLDPAVFSVVPRSDGTNQLKAGDWPLYTFAGDQAPGDTNGQGSGGVWFVVSPTGELVQDGAGGAAGDGGAGSAPSSTEAESSTTEATEDDPYQY
jgi:predicted lipoprotein with Yx(FWY)xxD motif